MKLSEKITIELIVKDKEVAKAILKMIEESDVLKEHRKVCSEARLSVTKEEMFQLDGSRITKSDSFDLFDDPEGEPDFPDDEDGIAGKYEKGPEKDIVVGCNCGA